MPAAREGGIVGAQAIRRAIEVIRAVAELQRTGANLSRVSKATGLNSSTAFRILRSLTEERMLQYDPQSRHYYLGLLAFELGLATQGQVHVQEQWRETIEYIASRTRLTTYLMARSDNEATCLLCVQGSMKIRAMPVDVGQRLPLGIGAGSLALLSTLDDEEIEYILMSRDSRLDLYPGGKDSTALIRERVRATKKLGYSVSSSSVTNGSSGVGVAILPRTGLLQLAISVSAAVGAIDPAEARQLATIIWSAINRNLTAIQNGTTLSSAA